MPVPHTILVVGSANTDMVIKADKFPQPGETILGGQFFMFPGGKGANQAVAAARLGGRVTFITKVGNDIFGSKALQQFKDEGIRTDYVFSDPENPSGVALITVNAKGENTIVVAQGSNGTLSPDDVQKAANEFTTADIVLMQLEIPMPTVLHTARLASQHGKKVILNPAPAAVLPAEIFHYLFMITPNKSETESLTGIEIKDQSSLEKAACKIFEKGIPNIVITLGVEGAFIFNDQGSRLIPTPKVKAVDTTAAGDIFNGALAVALSENKTLDEAVTFANQAAAFSVTKMGAQASAPFKNELIQTL